MFIEHLLQYGPTLRPKVQQTHGRKNLHTAHVVIFGLGDRMLHVEKIETCLQQNAWNPPCDRALVHLDLLHISKRPHTPLTNYLTSLGYSRQNSLVP